MTFPAHRPATRQVFAIAALLALIAPGCSKKPTAPTIPGPTRFVVFSSDRGRTAGSYRNYFATPDGAGATQIAPRNVAGLVDRHPSITQDGRLVAYQSSPGRAGSQDVLIFNRSGGGVTDNPNINTDFDEIEPQISLDGSRLVFVRDSLGIKYIRLFDLANNRLIPLPNLPAPGFSDWEPSLDALGRRIAFTTNRGGNSDVMLYRVTNQSLDPASAMQSATGDVEPALSGDGRYVAFASNRAGGAGDFDLHVFDLNTSLLVALPGNANTSSVDRDPTISYDGSIMVFVSNRPNGVGGMDLWNLNRIAGVLSQPAGEVSAEDDLEPSLVWP
jgi:Tol biopolymer transport system component